MNKENPTTWSSPTESVRRRWERNLVLSHKKPNEIKRGLFENLHETGAAEAEGLRHELNTCRAYQWWTKIFRLARKNNVARWNLGPTKMYGTGAARLPPGWDLLTLASRGSQFILRFAKCLIFATVCIYLRKRHIFTSKGREVTIFAEKNWQVENYLRPLEQRVLLEAPTRISPTADNQGWKTGCG